MAKTVRDYRALQNLNIKALEAFINHGSESIEALLSRPLLNLGAERMEPAQVDVVGNMEEGENALEYGEPLPIMCFIVPDPEQPALINDGSGEASGFRETPLIVLTTEPDVPEKSAITYYEQVDDATTRRVDLYVQDIQAFGQAPTSVRRLSCIGMEGILP